MKYLIIILSIFFLFACKEKNNNPQPITNFGLIKTPSDKLNSLPHSSGKVLSGRFPEKFALEEVPFPDISGQGQEGSCVAWAVGYGMRSYYLNKKYLESDNIDYKFVFSPEFIYNQIKTSNDCQKAGSYFVTTNGHKGALDLLVDKGVCTWQEMPYTDDDCGQQPNENQNNQAINGRIAKYEIIEDKSESNLKSILLNGFPIIIGAEVDFGFLDADAEFVWKEQQGGFAGNHAMLIMGYDDNKRAYKVLNSWGVDWGDNGYAWIDFDFLPKVVFECYIVYVQSNSNQAKKISLNGNLDFGSVKIGTSVQKTFEIKNIGTDAVEINSILLPEGFNSSFKGQIIEANQSKSISVLFSPISELEYSGIVEINCNATIENSLSTYGKGVKEVKNLSEVVFYSLLPSNSFVDLYVDNKLIGSIYFSLLNESPPSCGENIRAKAIMLEAGSHKLFAKSANSSQTWSFNFIVVQDGCNKVSIK